MLPAEGGGHQNDGPPPALGFGGGSAGYAHFHSAPADSRTDARLPSHVLGHLALQVRSPLLSEDRDETRLRGAGFGQSRDDAEVESEPAHVHIIATCANSSGILARMTPFLFTIAGIVLLFAGGESLVRGAVALAHRIGVSPLLVADAGIP